MSGFKLNIAANILLLFYNFFGYSFLSHLFWLESAITAGGKRAGHQNRPKSQQWNGKNTDLLAGKSAPIYNSLQHDNTMRLGRWCTNSLPTLAQNQNLHVEHMDSLKMSSGR